MQISQSTFFQLSCASFLAGLALALLYDFLYMTRLWLLPSDKRYTVAGIQKLRVSRIKEGKNKARKGLQAALFWHDVFFCMFVALVIVLLLYFLNNGAFRAAAPLCMAVGFWLFKVTLSKSVRTMFQWLAFGIETIINTLITPIKRLFVWIVKRYKKIAQKQRQKRLFKQRQLYTQHTLQHIEQNTEMLLPIYKISRTKKGEGRARKSKKAV